jgi:hypothetical protein
VLQFCGMKNHKSTASLLGKFRRSGLSVSRFCLLHGIEVSTLSKLVKQTNPELEAGDFQPLILVDHGQVLYPVLVPKY